MKVRVPFWRTLISFAIATLILAVAFFFLFSGLFLRSNWDWRQPTIIGSVIVFSIVFLLMSIKRNYYVVNRKYVTVVRGRRELVYYYSDIVYIDEKQSEKKKTICFYTNKGHARYLQFDKDNVLYKAMLAGSKNRLTDEEFKERYPNVKL